MSVATEVQKIEGYFVTLGGWLKDHFKKLPAAEVQISSAVNYVVPFVEELDTLVDPEIALEVNPVLDAIKVGLAALAVTIKDSSPAGKTNVTSIVNSLTANSATLETAFKVKNPDTQNKITQVLTLISGEFSAIKTQLGA